MDYQAENCIEILKKLIAFETVNPPGNEKWAADYLAELLTPYGFRCTVQDLGENRANLIAETGSEDGPELMLNGHLDVVPVSDGWTSNPFEAFFRGGRLYGRGSADMKGGVAAMCSAAMQYVRENGAPQRGRLKLLFVADEESSNLGIRSYLKAHRPGTWAVIGEPTDLRIAVAHRGVSRDYIELHGKARHAALPETEESAVTKAARAIRAMESINRRLSAYTHEVLPSPSIAVTMLDGYEKDNVVPETVRLLLDFRILPRMTHEAVEEILRTGMEQEGIRGYKVVPHFYMPGGETPSSDPFVKLCLEAKSETCETDGEELPCAFDASCEQCFLVEQGVKTIICGPGSLSEAHTANEFTEVWQVEKAKEIYRGIIHKAFASA